MRAAARTWGFGLALLALLVLGLPATCAQADGWIEITATGSVLKPNGSVCSDGTADLYFYDVTGQHWQNEGEAAWQGSATGTFEITKNLEPGTAITLSVECADADVNGDWVWYGAATETSVPTSENSKTITSTETSYNFEPISVSAGESLVITGKVARSDDGGRCDNGRVYLQKYSESTGWGFVTNSSSGLSASDGVFSISSARLSKGDSFTVKAVCWDGGYSPVWYLTGATAPGAPTSSNSGTVTLGGQDLDVGTLTVAKTARVSGKFLLADGSVLPATDTGGIRAYARLCEVAVACTEQNSSYELNGNAAGVFSAEVLAGSYDLWVYARGEGDHSYPETVKKIPGLVVPAGGLTGLAIRTAEGPAATNSGAAIIGTPKFGAVLTANPGTWDLHGYPNPAVSLGYQWSVNGQLRSTAATYKVQLGDLGKELRLRQTAGRSGFVTGAVELARSVPEDRGSSKVAGAKFAKLKKGKKGSVKVTIKAGSRPTGTITVAEGSRRLGTATLLTKHKGTVTVKFSSLKKGKHTLTLAFSGNASYRGTAKAMKVRVK